MKKNFSFKILYLISILIGIYFAYLFHKQFSLNLKAIVIIEIITISLFLLLTKNWIKNNQNFKFCKKQKLLIKIISCGLSFILIKCNLTFFVGNCTKIHFFYIYFILSMMCLYYIFLMVCIYFINNKEKRGLILIVMFCLMFGTCYFVNVDNSQIYEDSYSYIYYDFSRLSTLQFDERTPIYPIIIDINRKLFGVEFLTFVCIFQYIMWFIGIIFLYKTLSLLIKNDKLNVIFTIFYIISPSIVLWNNMIMTESIALSGTLIFIYLIIKYIKTNKCLYAYFSIILSLILTFHRPTSIIYLVGLFIFFIFRMIFENEKIKFDFKCFIISCISVSIVVIYAILYHRTYGIYSLSEVVVRQDLIVAIEQGYYKSSNNTEFIQYIDEQIAIDDEIWTVTMNVLSKYKNEEIIKITNECRMKNISKYINYILTLIKNHSNNSFTAYYVPKKNWLISGMDASFLNITFLHVYIITLIQLILTIFKWIKNKSIPWINAGLFAFPFIIVLSSFVGTCFEFMRTSVCCVPFTFISIAMITDFGIKFCNKD